MMRSDQALDLYFDVVANGGNDDAIEKELLARGCDSGIARLLVNLVPLAFGRVLLEGLVSPHADCLLLSPDGNLIESHPLADEPVFRLAIDAARRRRDLMERLALRSSEVKAVNSAMRSGTAPEDIRMAPAAIFVGRPTPEGLLRAELLLGEYMDGTRAKEVK